MGETTMIPKERFDQVNNRRKELEEQVETINQEKEELEKKMIEVEIDREDWTKQEQDKRIEEELTRQAIPLTWKDYVKLGGTNEISERIVKLKEKIERLRGEERAALSAKLKPTNPAGSNQTLYTREDIKEMSVEEWDKKKKGIFSQWQKNGL